MLPEEQLQALMAETEEAMQVEGAENMEKRVFGKREYQRQHEALLSTIRAENEELKRQLSAQGQLGERQANGADLVDGGGGSLPLDTDPRARQQQAGTMDEYFANWFGNAA